MHDANFEERLRQTLRADADSLPFTLTADHLAARLRARRVERLNRRLMLGAAAALVVAVGIGGALVFSNRGPGPTVGESPSPSAASTAPASLPATSEQPTLTLPYPESESLGNARLAFVNAGLSTVSVDIICEWTSTAEVGYFYHGNPVDILGEQVTIDVKPRADAPHALTINRTGHANYSGSPTTGNAGTVEHSADWRSGRIVLTDLAPDPNAAPEGPLLTPPDGWTRPLGGNEANAKLSGEVTWSCQPPPATVPDPISQPTEPAGIDTTPTLPPVTVVYGATTRLGTSGCGARWNIGGRSGGDSCGPSYQVLDDSQIVRIRAGQPVTFVLEGGWAFIPILAVSAAPQADAVRFRGAEPDSLRDWATPTAASGPTFELRPETGDWAVRVFWSAQRGTDTVQGVTYFRFVVEP